MSVLTAVRLDWMSFKGPSQSKTFHDSVIESTHSFTCKGLCLVSPCLEGKHLTGQTVGHGTVKCGAGWALGTQRVGVQVCEYPRSDSLSALNCRQREGTVMQVLS